MVNQIPKVILFNSIQFRFEEKIRNDLDYFEKEILLLSLVISNKDIVKNKEDLVNKINSINKETLDNCNIETANKYNLLSIVFSLEEAEAYFLCENHNGMIKIFSSFISKYKNDPIIEKIAELSKPDAKGDNQ